MNKNYSSKIGRTAAGMVAIETVVFAVSLAVELAIPSEFIKNLGYIASLLIAPSVVVMMACFYDGFRDERKIFGLMALADALIYATYCMTVYFLQLSVVAFNPLDLSTEVMRALIFNPGSPTFAVDMLGYGFLCLSTLAAGFGLTDAKDKALRALCFFHGAIALPTFAAPIISGIFRSAEGEANAVGNYVLLFWCAVFVPIALLFMRYFRQQKSIE